MLRCYLGIGSTSVKIESPRKSISVERTFRPISTREQLMAKVEELSRLLEKDLEGKNIKVIRKSLLQTTSMSNTALCRVKL